MAADMAHENIHPAFGEEVMQQEPGTIIPLPRREAQQEAPDTKEREMLDAFRGFTQNSEGLDTRGIESGQLPKTSHAAHEFLFAIGTRYVEAHAPADPNAPPRFFTMPKPPVERRIKEYYQQFGTERRTKSPQLLEPEEAYLEAKRRQLEVRIYGSGGDSDGAGALTPVQQVTTRAAAYPEIAVGLRLEAALRKDGQQLSADAVEVVLAAYGARLSEMRIQELGRRGVTRVAKAPMIKRPDTSGLPEELRAEKYRPR